MSLCDECYNEEYEDYECLVNLDEDDLYRFYQQADTCPYFRLDDEYGVVKKQN